MPEKEHFLSFSNPEREIIIKRDARSVRKLARSVRKTKLTAVQLPPLLLYVGYSNEVLGTAVVGLGCCCPACVACAFLLFVETHMCHGRKNSLLLLAAAVVVVFVLRLIRTHIYCLLLYCTTTKGRLIRRKIIRSIFFSWICSQFFLSLSCVVCSVCCTYYVLVVCTSIYMMCCHHTWTMRCAA